MVFYWGKHLRTCDLSGLWLLAESSDWSSGHPGQNPELSVQNVFLYKTQPHCIGLVKKVDLLSISHGLKAAELTVKSDQKTSRPGQKS